MKDGIHPDYHEITVVMTDGTTYKTTLDLRQGSDTLRLDIDSKSASRLDRRASSGWSTAAVSSPAVKQALPGPSA